jgi:probable F420-dependent oxidoreductase
MPIATSLRGVGVWAVGLRFGERGEIADAAAELEDLGYSALWIPDVGGDVFGAADRLLRATRSVPTATGVLNLWRHTAEETAAGCAQLAEAHGDRFLLGIGVSHAPLIDKDEPGRYAKPLAAMRSYLDGLDVAATPVTAPDRVLSALGPKMLELARDRSAGAHPYNVSPKHTALAREALGPSAALLPEQAVALITDPAEARALGRQYLADYFGFPNYVNNWRRLGFDDEDFTGGGSDRLVDAILAWGDDEAIAARVREHFDAGADHVCVQVISDEVLPRSVWRAIAPALTA